MAPMKIKKAALGLGALSLVVGSVCSGQAAFADQAGSNLNDNPTMRGTAEALVSSAEAGCATPDNSVGYIEHYDDRGFTAGISGWTTKYGDMNDVIDAYNKIKPDNQLKQFQGAIADKAEHEDGGTDGLEGLPDAWHAEAQDGRFLDAQHQARDMKFNPAESHALDDGLGAVGQFIYYDTYVVHGATKDDDTDGLKEIRDDAKGAAKDPKDGGDEKAYLTAFLEARKNSEKGQDEQSPSRIKAWQKLVDENADLNVSKDHPLDWRLNQTDFRWDGEHGTPDKCDFGG